MADIRIFIISYFVLYCPSYSMLHVLFLEAATGSYSLKQVFPKKLNTSRNFKLPHFLFLECRNIFFSSNNSISSCFFIKSRFQEDKMVQKMYFFQFITKSSVVYIIISPASDIFRFCIAVLLIFQFCFAPKFFMNKNTIKTIQKSTIFRVVIAMVY